MEVSECHNKTKEDVVEKSSSVREAAPFKLRFPRQNQSSSVAKRRRRRRRPFRCQCSRSLTIEGQLLMLQRCALRKFHVTNGQNTRDQVTSDRRSKRA